MDHFDHEKFKTLLPVIPEVPRPTLIDPELLRSLAPMSPKKSDLPVLREIRNTLNTTLMAHGQTDIAMAWIRNRGNHTCLCVEQEIEVDRFWKNGKNRASLLIRSY